MRGNRCTSVNATNRLYSHRAFHASLGVRSVLAILGTMAMQGSIKVQFLRVVHLQLLLLMLISVVYSGGM